MVVFKTISIKFPVVSLYLIFSPYLKGKLLKLLICASGQTLSSSQQDAINNTINKSLIIQLIIKTNIFNFN